MRITSILLLTLLVVLAGCSGGSTTPNDPSSPAPNIAGQWDFFSVSNTGQLGVSVVANLQEQSTTAFFSTPATTLQFLMPPYLCALAANDTGCIFPPNQYSGLFVNASLGLGTSPSQWAATVQVAQVGNSFHGDVNLASSPQIEGETTVGSENGVFVGMQMPSFSGSYSGNLSTTQPPPGQGLSNFPLAVSMTLNQDQSWNITGKATFVTSGCSQTVTISNSAAVGGTAYLNGANSATTVEIQLMQAWTPFNYDPGFNTYTFPLPDPITGTALSPGQIRVNYAGNICGASGGEGTLTRQ